MVDLADLLDLIEPPPEPHHALVAVMRPTPRQVTEAAAFFGWMPEDEDRLFAVPAGVWEAS